MLLEIRDRQHLMPGRESPAAGSCSCCVLTNFPDLLLTPSMSKRGNQRQAKTISLLGSMFTLKVFLFCLTKQAHSVLEYHCGVLVRETGSTKSHFSPQHRQKMTERDLGPSTVCGGRLLEEVLLLSPCLVVTLRPNEGINLNL